MWVSRLALLDSVDVDEAVVEVDGPSGTNGVEHDDLEVMHMIVPGGLMY